MRKSRGSEVIHRAAPGLDFSVSGLKLGDDHVHHTTTVIDPFWERKQSDDGGGNSKTGDVDSSAEWNDKPCETSLPWICSRSSKRRRPVADFLCLGLLSVFLVIGLIGLGVHYHYSVCGADTKLSTIKSNLTELLQASQIKLTFLTEERNELKTSFTELTAKLNRLQCLCRQNKTCPDGWTKFCCSCYFLSTKSGSWTTGRDHCRTRGADLVVIHSAEEQIFLSKFINKYTWIGLSDRDREGTWKWVEGTPLTVTYWASNNPNNGKGRAEWGEEDCVEILGGSGKGSSLKIVGGDSKTGDVD
ncbi:CD209 antigen-like [Anabas testudineus]|uniref:CD209 antigen-like n=1 Tax=Anabas testudineus TaxID=64144 RepID=UPI000E463A5B|nr:CD209 antigen-like [Anabas testudineus]